MDVDVGDGWLDDVESHLGIETTVRREDDARSGAMRVSEARRGRLTAELLASIEALRLETAGYKKGSIVALDAVARDGKEAACNDMIDVAALATVTNFV